MNLKSFAMAILVWVSGSIALALPFQTAKIQGLVLQADELFRDTENEIVELEGRVQVIFQNQHLKCQKARINLRAKTVDAIGDVLVTSPQANIGGDRVLVEYESNTGVIYNGYVQSGTVLFEGEVIYKLSESEYIANEAKYTACTTCPEAWSFSGNKIRAQLGGYAYIKNSWMSFSGLRVLWLPYLVVPLKSDRQTGLLTPYFSILNPGGLVLSQPFFWAISRSQDATITMRNYELRGLKSLVEYNYMLSEESYGRFSGAFLPDRVFSAEPRVNQYRNAFQKNGLVNRWFFNYDHYYELPDGFIHRAQFSNASDLQYPKDFDLEMKGNLDSALENRMSVTKNTASRHFSLDSSYYVNLLQSDPMANNDSAVHRLPELRFSQTINKIGDSDFLFSFDMNYVNFARNGPGYDELNAAYNPNITNNDRYRNNTCGASNKYFTDDSNCTPTDDGFYDENRDLIRTGQRFDFNPVISRPFRTGVVDFVPKIGYRETQYNFGFGEKARINRRYVRAEFSARSSISRVYGDFQNAQSDRLRHEIQPELSATAIPWFDQPDHPFFGYRQGGDIPVATQQTVSDQDLNTPFGLQFDFNDRIFDRKLVTFALTNKLTQKKWENDNPQYLQFFSWRLAQSYDAFQDEKNEINKQPYSDVSSDLRLTLPNLQFLNQLNYYPYQHVTKTISTIRYENSRSDAASIRYENSYNISPGKEVDRSTRTEEYKLILRKYSKSIDFLATTVYDANPRNEKRFKLWAYGVEIKIPGDCSSIQIFDKIEDGKRDQNVVFGFVWDGQAKSTFINQLSAAIPFGI